MNRKKELPICVSLEAAAHIVSISTGTIRTHRQRRTHPRTNDMQPIHMPKEWLNDDLPTFEQFCRRIQLPPRTVRDWQRGRSGPRWTKLDGSGRRYITVAETHCSIDAAATVEDPHETANQHTALPNVVDTNGSRG